MNTKDEITAKIASLKAYSVAKNAKTGALFNPLESAADEYFSGNKSAVSSACEDVVKYMYNDISRRTTVYEHEYDTKLATDFPTGYDDITECFADLSGMLEVSNETFYAAFVFGPDPVTGVTGPLSNSYIDEWTEELEEAKTGDTEKVLALAEWCKNSGGSSDVIDLLEDKGEEISSLSREEIATKIYREKKLLDAIGILGLATYVPTFLKGGG